MNRSLLFALLLLAGPIACRSGRPLPPATAAPLPLEEVRRLFQDRSRSFRTLYAELAIRFEMDGRTGSFEAVCHHQAPDRFRIAAYKDLGLAIQPVFDLLVRDDTYHLERVGQEGGGSVTDAGPLESLPRRHPLFSPFSWVGDALFRPGSGRVAGPIRVWADAARVPVRLRSGATAIWLVGPGEPAIREGRVIAPDGSRIRLTYHEIERVKGSLVPRRVEMAFRRGEAQGRLDVRVVALELDAPVDPSVFDPDTVGPHAQ